MRYKEVRKKKKDSVCPSAPYSSGDMGGIIGPQNHIDFYT
jgi:hypothetical protein